MSDIAPQYYNAWVGVMSGLTAPEAVMHVARG